MVKPNKKNKKKVNLRRLMSESYKTTFEFQSINKEYSDGSMFKGTFLEIKEVDTKFGLTDQYIFEDNNSEKWSLLTKSKVFAEFFKANVDEGDFVILGKDQDENLWYIEEVESQ